MEHDDAVSHWVPSVSPTNYNARHTERELGPIAGAAAFAVFKLYERRQAQNGQPIAHAGAKAALASLIGFEVGEMLNPHQFT